MKSGIDTDRAMTGIFLDVLSFVDPIIWLVTTWDAISNQKRKFIYQIKIYIQIFYHNK